MSNYEISTAGSSAKQHHEETSYQTRTGQRELREAGGVITLLTSRNALFKTTLPERIVVQFAEVARASRP